MANRLKIGQEVLIHGYVDEIRNDIIIIRNDGGYFGTVEHEITDIKLSNTDDVIEGIKAEIREWYWLPDKQAMAEDPCIVDAMIDLFIRTIDEHMSGESQEREVHK